ncbi:oxidoreductase-like protein [Rubrobacter xylanophilus DSM 9941]|uniref:Oxidoreductase-like protein n=1 Tax=Rubrobacter xylanophilus (strain DSM 9941 / JCM 11954 / NBRC 16129 / PRD-1) TaxID=266117 RepID=Q1AZ11_RUBXD|nr:Gfo/Idh/MocA family oxidoreductase [Rubrobacter xylanophilus]ABG03367.1 oxidoreductase-like protein [Rubrobacter xylanophilus DSM 9941]
MQRLKMGMVGGGEGSFIGAVHRRAAALDGEIELVAGALSSTPEKALRSGRALGLPEGRNYASWEEMLEGELALPEEERIDFVSIVTPNHMHFPVARAFVRAGFDVICDKPLVHTSEQALELVRAVEKAGTIFCVTYNYTGYPMVRQARHMVRSGMLGELRKVIVEYSQGWLVRRLEDEDKQARWRTDPSLAGAAGAIGDIGSHAENLVATVTGLRISEICADLTTFVEGRRLDDDGNLLVRYEGGAKGVMISSQISTGEENNLSLRVYGTEGALQWRQEEPNHLLFAPFGKPVQTLRRGNPYLCEEARAASRLPAGHPEAFIEAFANLYLEAAAAMRARRGLSPERPPDFPTVYDGARGVHFIERVVESSRSEKKWLDARWEAPQPEGAGASGP